MLLTQDSGVKKAEENLNGSQEVQPGSWGKECISFRNEKFRVSCHDTKNISG